MHADDAQRLGIADGEMVEFTSRCGSIRVAAKFGEILPGHVFRPFHYGSFGSDRPRAANELTFPEWDLVRKQPVSKSTAVHARKAGPLDTMVEAASIVVASKATSDRPGPTPVPSPGKTHLGDYLSLANDGESALADAFDQVGDRHDQEPEMKSILRMF